MIPVATRHATPADLELLVRLYRDLEAEMSGLSAMWPLAEGLPEPVDDAFSEMLAAPDVVVLVGEIDGAGVGFLVARVAGLLPQAGGERRGVIPFVFVDEGARGVGVGEALLETALDELRGRGIRRFDAHVLPGHRLAKNFFESGGFAARSIIMYHEDAP